MGPAVLEALLARVGGDIGKLPEIVEGAGLSTVEKRQLRAFLAQVSGVSVPLLGSTSQVTTASVSTVFEKYSGWQSRCCKSSK